MTQSFQKALIPIEHPESFGELRSVIDRVFAVGRVEQFLKRLVKKGVSVRDLQEVLDKRILEEVDEILNRSDKTARRLYDGLSVSDQAQMRELYLTAVESIEPGLREQYAKIYRYY